MSYRDILRGAELKTEYDKYQTYLAKSRSEKQALYDALNVNKFTYNKSTYYIAPFGQAAKTIYIAVSMAAAGTPSPGAEGLSLTAEFHADAAPVGTGDTIIDSASFAKNKLAKVLFKRRVTTATTNSISRITGRGYKRHQTNSVSIYIGKATATDDFSNVVKTIKAKPAYDTFNDVVGNSITFIPEG
jgi:hypothetical protein